MRFEKYFIFLFVIIFLFNNSSAAIERIGPFRTGQIVTLTQTCDNCTFVNITRVTYPNSTQQYVNLIMNQPIKGNFNQSFSTTQSNGDYIATTCGDPDGTYMCDDYYFTVNPLGKTLSEAQARLYTTIIIISFIFLLICFAIGIYLPTTNRKDEMTGYIIAVDNLKYLKMFFLAISYLTFIVIVYFGYTVCYAYLDLDFLGNILYFLFYTLTYLLIPFFILTLYFLIANGIRDSKLNYELERGFKVR